MRSLRLRHRADGAQGVVELGGGGNSVPGESTVLVVASAAGRVTAAVSSAGAGTVASRISGASPAASPAAELAQELVLVLDAPFTRPQL